MSEITLPAQAESKRHTPALVEKFQEFRLQLRIAMSIHLNRVTKFNSLAVTLIILAVLNALSIFASVQFGIIKASHLILPLQLVSWSAGIYVTSYLFPIVHHIMRYYSDKKDRAWKQHVKAEKKKLKESRKQELLKQESENGSYSI
jgi:hypothetical protein